MQGIINILKPPGLTSSDVVVKVRGILRQITGEKVKAGHLGTLDPGASGVLIIAIGKAARLFDILQHKRKIYRARITFGKSTDTIDSYGRVTDKNSYIPEREQLEEVLNDFVGEINQVPPHYSAINIDGKKAYELAREGVDFSPKAKKIVINSIKIIERDNDSYILDVDCMGGTYIRSLVRDIAKKLNTEAYMSLLIRLNSNGTDIKGSKTLEEFKENPEVLSEECILKGYARYDIDSKLGKQLLNGIKIKVNDTPQGKFLLYYENSLFGVAHNDNNTLKIDVRL